MILESFRKIFIFRPDGVIVLGGIVLGVIPVWLPVTDGAMVHGVILFGGMETANLNENYKKLFIIIVSGMEFEQNTIGAKSRWQGKY